MRQELRVEHVIVRRAFGGRTEEIGSFIEAAVFCAQNTTKSITIVCADEAGNHVEFTFTGTHASNVPCYMSAYDPSAPESGKVEIPLNAPHP